MEESSALVKQTSMGLIPTTGFFKKNNECRLNVYITRSYYYHISWRYFQNILLHSPRL